jgi:hypothetical protein
VPLGPVHVRPLDPRTPEAKDRLFFEQGGARVGGYA